MREVGAAVTWGRERGRAPGPAGPRPLLLLEARNRTVLPARGVKGEAAVGERPLLGAVAVIGLGKADAVRVAQRRVDHLRAGVKATARSFREIRGIVKDSAPTESAALLTLQLVRWQPGP